MPEEAPLPIEANYFVATDVLEIIFDRPLTLGAVNGPNWRFTTENQERLGITGVPSGSTILFVGTTFVTGGIFAPEVFYEPPPFDVLGITGVRVEAFEKFPINLLP